MADQDNKGAGGKAASEDRPKDRPWMFRTYAGHSNAKASNELYRTNLSRGQKQWLEIGMLLIQKPDLLMLDEPVAGMSVAERKKTAELLRVITRDHTVLVIEHDMQFVGDIALVKAVACGSQFLLTGPRGLLFGGD